MGHNKDDQCIHYRAPRRKRERERAENIFTHTQKIRAENFPNLGKEVDIWIQTAHKGSNKVNPKRLTKAYFN